MSADDNVVRLPNDPIPAEEPPVTPPAPMHGVAIAGMAASALIGIIAMLAFITVNWPGQTSRYIVGTIVVAGIAFLTCASLAVLTAARATYASSGSGADEERERR